MAKLRLFHCSPHMTYAIAILAILCYKTVNSQMQCRCGNGTYPVINRITNPNQVTLCQLVPKNNDYSLVDCSDPQSPGCGALSCEVCGWNSAPAGSAVLVEGQNLLVIQAYCKVDPKCPTTNSSQIVIQGVNVKQVSTICPAQQYRVQSCNNSDPDQLKWKRLACRWCDDDRDKDRFQAEYSASCGYPPDPCWFGLGYVNADIDEKICVETINRYGQYTGPQLVEGVNVSSLGNDSSHHLFALPCGWSKPLIDPVSDMPAEYQIARNMYMCSLPPMCATSCPVGSFMYMPCVKGVQRSVCMRCSKKASVTLDTTQTASYVAACVPTTTTTTTVLPTTARRSGLNAAAVVEETTPNSIAQGGTSPVLLVLVLLLLIVLVIILIGIIAMRYCRKHSKPIEAMPLEEPDMLSETEAKVIIKQEAGDKLDAAPVRQPIIRQPVPPSEERQGREKGKGRGKGKDEKSKSIYDSNDLLFIDEHVPEAYRVRSFEDLLGQKGRPNSLYVHKDPTPRVKSAIA